MKKIFVCLLPVIVLCGSILACGQETKSSPPPTPTIGPTPTPLPLQVKELEGITVQILCLEVDQSFPEVTNLELEEITPHVNETAQRILAALGMQTVEDSCDATLAITMIGEAVGTTYLNAGYCYQGAEVNGEIRITVAGYKPFSVPISSRTEPPQMIREDLCMEEPYLAPFSQVWLNALLDGLVQLWGPDVLIATMWDEEWEVSSAALEILGRIEPIEGVAPALIQILESDEFYQVRADAAIALGNMGDQEGVVPALIRVLKNEEEDDSVRMGTAISLMQIGPQAAEAVPVLIQILLNEGDAVLSPLAAEALCQIDSESSEVISALIQALDQNELFVRKAAAEALGRIGPQAIESVPALIQALGDEQRLVSEAAAKALRAVTGQDFGDDPETWQEWWEGSSKND